MKRPAVLTVTPNPALDLAVQAPNWQPDAVNLAAHAQTDAGGKGVNVAALLADWSQALSVSASGFLGAENAGPFEALFRERGIRDEFLRLPGETRLGIKITDPAAGHTTDFNLPGLRVSPADEAALLEKLTALAPTQSAVVLAGSLPPSTAPDFYARAVGRLRRTDNEASGPLLAVDTSGEALRMVLQAEVLPHILKPNIHELEAALGRPLPDDAAQIGAARELLQRGAQWVALSLGAAGAWLVWPEGAVRAQPPRVQVLSTVGAGDAMVAGLVSAWLDGLTPSEALRRATAFSAGNITRLGAHLPPHAELLALQAQVTQELHEININKGDAL